MNKRRRTLLITFGLTVLSILICLLLAVIATSQQFDDYFFLKRRETPRRVAVAFATALRLNHQDAYELTDPDLWPRLDEWMSMHEVQTCEERVGDVLGGGIEVRFEVDFSCYLEGGGIYSIRVKDIILENGDTVVDWGEVTEENN